MKVKVALVVSNSLHPHGLYSPWNSPGQNARVASLSLLQGNVPTQGLNPGLLYCRRFLYQLSHKGSTMNIYGVLVLEFFWERKSGNESIQSSFSSRSTFKWRLYCSLRSIYSQETHTMEFAIRRFWKYHLCSFQKHPWKQLWRGLPWDRGSSAADNGARKQWELRWPQGQQCQAPSASWFVAQPRVTHPKLLIRSLSLPVRGLSAFIFC